MNEGNRFLLHHHPCTASSRGAESMPGYVCSVSDAQEELKSMSVGRMNGGHQQSSCAFTVHPEPPASTAMVGWARGPRLRGGNRFLLRWVCVHPAPDSLAGWPTCSLGMWTYGDGSCQGSQGFQEKQEEPMAMARGTGDRVELLGFVSFSRTVESAPLSLSNRVLLGLTQPL